MTFWVAIHLLSAEMKNSFLLEGKVKFFKIFPVAAVPGMPALSFVNESEFLGIFPTLSVTGYV